MARRHTEALERKENEVPLRTFGGMTPNKSVERYWVGRTPWISPKDMKVPEIFDSKDHISDAALKETGISVIADEAVLIVVRGMILALNISHCYHPGSCRDKSST